MFTLAVEVGGTALVIITSRTCVATRPSPMATRWFVAEASAVLSGIAAGSIPHEPPLVTVYSDYSLYTPYTRLFNP